MGRTYKQLSLEERCEIARLSASGSSIRQIAAAMDRQASTISRELKRNRGAKVGYKPTYAQQQMKARRWSGVRLTREHDLRRAVLERLGQGWSPEQVAGRLARERGRKVISYETIYRFIYAQIRRTNDFTWRRYLPRSKSKRGIRGKRGGSPASFIEGRVSLAERPLHVDNRRIPGHWEADLMMFSKYGQAILTVHERTSRVLFGIRLASKVAVGVARHLARLFATLPKCLRQTVTFDNGTEFACHLALHSLSIETFFCDPHSPWQKGGIENAIGRMRRFMPRKTDLDRLPTRRFRRMIAAYNNTPRKCLDFRTPAEVFSNVLHFECESTSRPSPGRQQLCGSKCASPPHRQRDEPQRADDDPPPGKQCKTVARDVFEERLHHDDRDHEGHHKADRDDAEMIGRHVGAVLVEIIGEGADHGGDREEEGELGGGALVGP